MENKTKTEASFGFDFVGRIGLFGGISAALVVISLGYLAVRGISYGIDFSGGTEIQVKFAKTVSIEQVRELAEKQGLRNVDLQAFGDGSEFIIRFQTETGKTDKETNENQSAAIAKLRSALETELQAQGPDVRRVDSVGPQVGAELKRNGFLAVFYSLLVILIYISLRFDYKYSPGAVVCLFHDAVITLAIFVAIGKEVNIPVMAAILTLIGYSLNDTIVVFDRIREFEPQYRDRGSKYVINRAINDMVGRTLITAGALFVSAFSLFLFTSGTVADIAFAISVGTIFGTYSSVYVAAPLILMMEKLKLSKG